MQRLIVKKKQQPKHTTTDWKKAALSNAAINKEVW